MNTTLSEQAVQCALDQNWPEAINLNNQILAEKPDDVGALNRLAYAYLKTGNIPEAKESYSKVLQFDKYNPIAKKNLDWLEKVNKKDINKNIKIVSNSPTIFLEEPGKTKILPLINPATTRILCNILTGQKVELVTKKRTIEIRDSEGTYIGALPDDISHRLHRFMDSGNEYDAYIKKVTKNSVSVFVRETKRSKVNHDIPSFSL